VGPTRRSPIFFPRPACIVDMAGRHRASALLTPDVLPAHPLSALLPFIPSPPPPPIRSHAAQVQVPEVNHPQQLLGLASSPTFRFSGHRSHLQASTPQEAPIVVSCCSFPQIKPMYSYGFTHPNPCFRPSKLCCSNLLPTLDA
jgi:hypothetical protein